MPSNNPFCLSGVLFAVLVSLSACSSGTQTSDSADLAVNSSEIHPESWPKQSSPLKRDPLIEQKIAQLLEKMTLEEKVGQIIQADIASVTPAQVRQYHLGSVLNGGNSAPGRDNRVGASAWLTLADEFWFASIDKSDGRVGIPTMWGTDAVHGHSNVVGATIFPHNIGLGAARDPVLMKRIGEITATEMLVTGLDWTFAPTIAVARNDRWGRTYESYSEDPAIVRDYAPKLVEGIQGKVNTEQYLDKAHMLATVKHFLGDGGTINGLDQGENNSTEAELRDIHGAGYPPAIAAGALAVMASYNSWHGEKMHGYKALLTDVLVGRMGFDGLVVGDWNGHGQVKGCTTTSCAASINNGLDLFMAPDSWEELYNNTLQQVKAGEISTERLHEAVARVLRVKFRMGLFDETAPSKRALAGKFELLGSPAHRAVAREAAQKSLVLLKNNNALLPIKANARVLITGDGADNIGKQTGGWTLSWQGTGNTNENFPNGDSIYAGIKAAVEAGGGSAELSDNGAFTKAPDVAIVVFGEEPYAEFQGDRPHLDFDDDRGLQLLAKFKSQNIPTVAIFISGRPLWVNPELNQSDAFVAAWLPGTEGAAIADVIVRKPDGSLNKDFHGKLSFSWPNDAVGKTLNVGDKDYQPLFPYGYGLRYDSNTTLAKLHETSGLNEQSYSNVTRYLFAGKPVLPWQMHLIDQGKVTKVENATQASSHGAIIASAADRKQQEDTVIIEFQERGVLAFTQASETPIDLMRQMNGDMAIEFEFQVLAHSAERVRLGMACGNNCGASLDITEPLKKHLGQGWQTKQILLRCFNDTPGSTAYFPFQKVTSPVVLNSEKGLKIQIANIRVNSNEGNAGCDW